MQTYTLIEKKQLTTDVFELLFEGENELPFFSGQFITFMLEGLGARAYSLLQVENNIYSFIIKKIPTTEGGRGGSKYICDLETGATLKGIGPAGHFMLQDTPKNKLFLWTGTGFVPLYNMIVTALTNNTSANLHFIFWVRTLADMFYLEELEHLTATHENFSFEVYFSREKVENYKQWYITETISNATKDNFQEAYICGSPAMVDDAKEKLIANGFDEKNIFEEKY